MMSMSSSIHRMRKTVRIFRAAMRTGSGCYYGKPRGGGILIGQSSYFSIEPADAVGAMSDSAWQSLKVKLGID
jgi:hypothetical protein